MTEATNHLNHSSWECKYHVVFTPKYRKKELFGVIRRELKEVFHRLAAQKESKIEKGELMPDHVHMLVSIPPKYAVASVLGFLKGKSSIWGGTEHSGQEAKLCRPQVLGQRLLCLDGRSG